jgi:hypothetical protein
MLRVYRRIENLERALGVSDRVEPVVHHIHFIDGDGTVSGTLVIVHPSCALRTSKYSRNRKEAA